MIFLHPYVICLIIECYKCYCFCCCKHEYFSHWLPIQGRSYGGGGGTCPIPPSPQILGAPQVPPPPTKKNHTYIFFNLLISRVCKYFAPHKNHAYAFLKYALTFLFVNGSSSPSILKEIALLLFVALSLRSLAYT